MFKNRGIALMMVFALVVGMLTPSTIVKAAEEVDPYSLIADQLEIGNIADSLTVGIYTIKGPVDVDANSKTAPEPDLTVFTQRIKLGGTGDANSRSIHFKSPGVAEVTVYAMSSSSGSERKLGLYNSEGLVEEMVAPGPSLGMHTFTVSAGDYYLASPASGVNVYGVVLVDKTPKEEVYFLDASELDNASHTKDFIAAEVFTIKAAEGQNVDIDGNNKTAPDLTEFTKRIKLGGTGDATARSIHFNTTTGSAVTVYAMSSSSGSERELALYKLDGSIVDSMPAPGPSLGQKTFNIAEAGDYYLASTSGGVNVYGIRLVRTASDAKVVGIQPLDPITNKIGVIELPASVVGELDNDKTKLIFDGIEWDTTGIDFAVGVHTVPGTVKVDGKTFDITVEVTVVGISEIQPLEDITIEEGRILYLPEVVTAVYSDDSTAEVGVVWDTDGIDFTVGEHELEGTVENFDGKASIKVIVTEKQVSQWEFNAFGSNTSTDEATLRNPDPVFNQDGSITLEATGGKIASGDEGISFYSKEVDIIEDFKLSATATVVSFNSTSGISTPNQKSFGLMLRDGFKEGTGTQTANYVAVGALDTSLVRGFYKTGAVGAPEFTNNSGTQTKLDAFDVNLPAAEEVYNFSIEKFGDTYILSVNGQSEIVDLEDLFTETVMAGIYVARDAKVTFSNLKLDIYEPIVLDEEWDFSAFGSNSSSGRNPEPTVDSEAGTVKMVATGGKISSTDDGMSYYFKEVPTRANFEIYATVKVNSFNSESGISTPNQKSFGLMVRDTVGAHNDSSGHVSNYVAVGALDTVMKGFYKVESVQTKYDAFPNANLPTAGEEYQISIKKSGNTYVLTVDGESEVVTLDNVFGESMFAGLYVARDADVTFSNFDIFVDNRKVSSLDVDASAMKTNYLIGESLNPTGLVVKAVFQEGGEEVLLPSNYIITGFDSSVAGTNTVTINYNGKRAFLDLTIEPLTVTDMAVKYFPAKTLYYLDDTFDPMGLVVTATYNDGYLTADIAEENYTLEIDGVDATDYVFTTPGEITVTVVSTETPSESTTFKVEVLDAALEGIEITQSPEKAQYYIGDALDLDGIVVYANYSNGNKVRLMRNEFTVSPFDSSSAGDKVLTLTYKGQTTDLTVNVKVKDFTGLEVTKYPKTTYFIGQEFVEAGLEVSKVYDNGDREALAPSEYTVDTTGFVNTEVGKSLVVISLVADADEKVELPVTVREEVQVEWKQIIFGQSVSTNTNKISTNEDGSIRLQAGSIANNQTSAGKITGDHDGISFYYTEIDATKDNFVLSADIKVIEYAKAAQDGQESFGIMARDAIGKPNDSAVFASNIAAIGGYSGRTTNPNGTQLFIRTGVESSDGAGSQDIQNIMIKNERPDPSNTYPTKDYRLTLAKTNSGYTGQLNNGEEVIFFEPDILNVQDGKIYVGFYTARVATIDVYNIEFEVTATETDAPKVEKPAVPVAPGFSFVSLNKTPLTDYPLMFRANVNGTVTVKQGNTTLLQDVEVTKGQLMTVDTTIAKNADTNFSVTFIPDDTQLLTSYDKLVRNFTVTNRVFEGNEIYVATTGTSTGDGSELNPLDLDTAIDFVSPGQKIIVKAGHYVRNSKLEIKKYNDGTADAMKYLWAEEGAGVGGVVIDFDKKSEGVVHSGNFWHVKGIDFARSAGNTKGYTIGGSDNKIELSRFYQHGDTGLQISRTDASETNKELWPSRNLILNATSFDNRDPSDNNADGFAAKLTSGYDNIFDGCIAHNNIDDGWDLYTKVGTGAIGSVIIRNSVAYNNGFLTNGTVGSGDKNGFKLGGEGVHVPHVIENSYAFGNLADGFTSNSNPGVIAINNYAFNNGRNIGFSTYSGIERDFTLEGFISYHYNNSGSNDSVPAENRNNSNFLWNGSDSVNASGEKLSVANFSNLVMPAEVLRNADGSVDFSSIFIFDPTGSQNPDVPDDPTDPTDPVEPPAGAIFFESFEGATGDSLFTAGYRALPGDATKPMYIRKTGATSVDVSNDSITLTNGRFTIGADSSADSTATTKPNGALDLSKPYQIILDITKAEGAGNLVVYVDNNTTGMNNSPLGGASKVFDTPTADISVGQLVLEPEVGTEASFIQLRTSGSGVITINSVTIKYIEEEPVTPPGGEGGYVPRPSDDEQPTQPEQPKPEVIEGKNGVKVTTESVKFINGYAEGTVRPDNKMARQEVMSLIYELIVNEDKDNVGDTSFTDVSANAWSAKAISYLAGKGFVNGYGDGSFKPEGSITRAEFITIIANFLPEDATSGNATFTDAQGHWAKEAIEKVAAAGWINGYGDGTFRPDQEITRAEVIVVMNRILGRKANADDFATQLFSDLPPTHWAYAEIMEAAK